MRLAHLHFRHPIKNFARVEIAKNSFLELEKERRMKRITEVEERVRPGQASVQFLPGKAHAMHRRQIMTVVSGTLVEETVRLLQSMFAEPSLENADARFIFASI